jgi:hypothetical protein
VPVKKHSVEHVVGPSDDGADEAPAPLRASLVTLDIKRDAFEDGTTVPDGSTAAAAGLTKTRSSSCGPTRSRAQSADSLTASQPRSPCRAA